MKNTCLQALLTMLPVIYLSHLLSVQIIFSGGDIRACYSAGPPSIEGLRNYHAQPSSLSLLSPAVMYSITINKGYSGWHAGFARSAAPERPYFRSKGSGSWDDLSTWEDSPDGTSSWQDAVTIPQAGAGRITIRQPHTVTLTSDASASLLVIEEGSALTNTNTGGGYTLFIEDDGSPAPDLVINGTYFLFGNMPVFQENASAVVNESGRVIAENNEGAGQSDAFAYSSAVTFRSGAVFEWNNEYAFRMSGITYFPNGGAEDIPVFKITRCAPVAGGRDITTFNGLVEIDHDILFTGGSIKNFRNGLCGSATLVQDAVSGNVFHINATDAILGGTALRLNLSAPLYLERSVVIPADSAITISGANVNNNVAGNVLLVNGLLDMTDRSITNTNGSVVLNGYYRTSASGGFSSGSAFTNSSIPSGDIAVHSGSVIELYASGNQGLNPRTDFANLVFSGNGVKTPGGPFNPTGTITIKEQAVFDCTGRNIGDENTRLTMTDNSRLVVSTATTNPSMAGQYDLQGGVIEFANSQATFQSIRTIASSYHDIEISGTMVRNSSGNIRLNDDASFTILPGAKFTINADAIRGDEGVQSFIIRSDGQLDCGNALGFWGEVQGLNSPAVSNTIEHILLEPGSIIRYSRNGNQQITSIGTDGSIPYQHFVISGSGTKTAPGGDLLIEGDFRKTTDASFDHHYGRVLFSGNVSQHYYAASPQVCFYKMVNNNAAGLYIHDSLAVYRLLSLADQSKLILDQDITLRSDAMNTASIRRVSEGNIIYHTGRFIAERFINTGADTENGHRKSWQFVAAPAFGETIFDTWQEKGALLDRYGTWITDPSYPANGFDGVSFSPSMKFYDDATDGWTGISSTAIPLENEKGYMLFVRGDRKAHTLDAAPVPVILRTRGKLYTPDADCLPPVSVARPGLFRSVGNPYASAIDFSKISVSGSIHHAFIVWDPLLPGQYGVGGYQTISAATFFKPVPGGTAYYDTYVSYPYIQSGQAFFVQNTSAAPAALTFTEDCKVEDGNHLVHRGGADSNRSFLYALFYKNEGQLIDGNAIAFDRQFSKNIDADDVLKFSTGEASFSLKRKDTVLSVEAHPEPRPGDSIFYEIKNAARGNYRLVFISQRKKEAPEAYLLDRSDLTEYPLQADTFRLAFSITDDPSSFRPDRFMIVFRAAGAPLPLGLVWQADRQGNFVLISWEDPDVPDRFLYEVQRSSDGVDFTTVFQAASGAGLQHRFKDEDPEPGINYYRIRYTDAMGRIAYTELKKIVMPSGRQAFRLVPGYPVKIDFINQAKGKYRVAVWNAMGQLLQSGDIVHPGGSCIYDLLQPGKEVAGMCYVVITAPSGEKKVLTGWNRN